MTVYNQGDCVLIPFPFTDFSTIKQRPALIISSNRFNKTHQDVIVTAITSHVPEKLTSSDYQLILSDQQSGGLPKTSIVKIGKIVTIDQRLIHKKLGSLSPATLQNILVRVHQIIG